MRASILCIALSFCLIPVLSLNVWPLPKQFTTGTNVVNVADDGFTFQCKYSNGGACSQVLTDAFKRYEQYIFFNQEDIIPSEFPPEAPSLMTLNIVVNQANVALTMGVDESYDLSVSTSGNKATATLNAPNDWAALRGLETFSQLVELNLQTGGYQINGVPVSISDAPRFVHRGLLIDSSRHYLAIKDVLRVLDAMSFNKLNVLHWHIVDSQSFPLESTTFPLLSEKGAYFYTAVYSHDQVSQVLDYAWQRGIRVIPEFDMPGHSQSWGKGYPEIMTKCQISSPLSDVMNPIHETTYDFLTAFLKEMAGLFDEPFVHLGGDEVDPSCWENNTEIVNWMKQQGMTEPIELQGYFEEKIEVIAAGIGKTTILWEECFDYGFDLNDDTIINVWMNPQELINVIKAGRRAIQSGGYYLDRQVPTGEIHYFWMDTWQDFYNSDPLGDFYNLTDTEVSLVLGGEASMWGEQVDGDSIDIRVWPRASATAERLWSPREVNSTEEAQPRLINFRCDLTRRGIRASPIGSDFCYRGF